MRYYEVASSKIVGWRIVEIGRMDYVRAVALEVLAQNACLAGTSARAEM